MEKEDQELLAADSAIWDVMKSLNDVNGVNGHPKDLMELQKLLMEAAEWIKSKT
jgi:hypothetical protein